MRGYRVKCYECGRPVTRSDGYYETDDGVYWHYECKEKA